MTDDDRPSIAELQVAATRDKFTDEEQIILAAPVLLEIAAAGLAWEAAVCDSQSCETDDYIVASERRECAGDTHDDSCVVARMRKALIAALAKVRP